MGAYSHPHSFMDIKTTIHGNASHIESLHMSWTLDPMTSAYWLDGENLSEGNKQEILDKLADEVMNNILSFHYYTYLYFDKQPVKFEIVRHGKLSQDRAQLTLSFEIPLAKPQPLSKTPLILRVFEPSYYTDLSWDKNNGVQLSESLQEHCQVSIVEPTPTTEQIAYAMALPPDADPDDELGQLFTQTATIKCNQTTGS